MKDILSALKDSLQREIVDSRRKELKFHIHYIKTIQTRNRKDWLLKRCELVERVERQSNPVRVVYKGCTYNYPSYGHACYHIMLIEIDDGIIKIHELQEKVK